MLKRECKDYINKQSDEKTINLQLQKKLQFLGIKLDTEDGHLFYEKSVTPLKLNFELIFVRHGETFGNCGQVTYEGKIDHDMVKSNRKNRENRIFQGYVDTEINQLTEYGKQQALEVALKLEQFIQNGWLPDVIFYSPLSRAKETGLPFVKRNNLENYYFPLDDIKEMSFGSWDNRRISDFKPDDSSHLFYRNQHALIKHSGKNGDGVHQEAENFCEVLLRAQKTLQELNIKYSGKKILMFSHSMFGAACCILLGKGQIIEHGDYLAFDGHKKNGESYTMPNAMPFYLSGEQSIQSKKNFKM